MFRLNKSSSGYRIDELLSRNL